MKPMKQCCCCCSLQTGTIIIAILELIPLILSFILTANAIAQVDEAIKTTMNIGTAGMGGGISDMTAQFGTQIFKVALCFISLLIIRSMLLILGSCQEKLWMFFPWLGSQLNIIIAAPVFFIYALAELSPIPELCAGIVFAILISTAINGFFFLVVVSHFEEIRSKQAMLENREMFNNPLHPGSCSA